MYFNTIGGPLTDSSFSYFWYSTDYKMLERILFSISGEAYVSAWSDSYIPRGSSTISSSLPVLEKSFTLV